MSSAGAWCLIESDPGVFTELIKDFGVEGVQVEEIFSLDAENFNVLKPIYGLIFLFKCVPDSKEEGSIVEDSRLDDIFFAKQVISNACATQAIISVLLNAKDENIRLGSTLQEFKDFARSFDSTMKGLALSNSRVIRQVHNSFSRQQIFEFEEKLQKNEDSYHFIGYLPINGRLYELDGLKSGPVDHGAISSDDWLDIVRPVILKRMKKYAAGEIHFNLMAIVGDQKEMLEKRIEDLSSQLQSCGSGGMEVDVDVDSISSEIEVCRGRLKEEMRKREGYKRENIRRKHNYLPFIIELLRILASQGKLSTLIEKAKQKASEKSKN
ncbi:ubiquitin carboxyl-terminal hydrolase isozyme L5-like [Clavelina lepadiformis]|uniref:Ubiquitin carboxyl-terminal hydrolase n=1 Tax=Clavelina lepadiformis TaxID=159417 RepID=A0ABP0G2U5_CLALP